MRWFFCGVLIIGSTISTRATIRYEVSLAAPEQHLFHVRVTIPDVRKEITVQMAAWDALYQVRDFAAHAQNVHATGEDGQALPLSKTDSRSWRVLGQGLVRLEYAVLWDETGPFASQLNATHAFINPAMILFYATERRSEDVRVVYEDVPGNWRIAVELKAAQDSDGPAYVAANFDALADAPTEIGSFDEFRLEGINPPVRVVVHGSNWDRAQLHETLKRIVTYETGMMGEAPYSEYLFLFHIGPEVGGNGGGMEHANCTAISVNQFGAVTAVAAHEFFHLWNVKRIRPQTLEPLDRTREMPTRALWFAEGVTNTYGSYALLRSGLWTERQFLEDLSEQITELEMRPAHRWQSAEQSSLDAWYEKYGLYRRPDFSVSYYNKGQLLGVMLDILLRDETDNRKSLDDLMREMNRDFAQRGRFYRDSEDIRAAAEKITGRGMGEFFERYIAGTEEIPFEELLNLAGLSIVPIVNLRPEFGFTVIRGADGAFMVGQVEAGSSAENVGLRTGDVLISLEGADFPRSPERWLEGHKPGEQVKLHVRRGTQDRDVAVRLQEWREVPYHVQRLPNPTPKQRRILEGMLRGVTDSASH
jgi:predicted metalloprotease with PDZ domain